MDEVKVPVALSCGVELDLPESDRLALQELSTTSRMTELIMPMFLSWDSLVNQLNPRTMDQWSHLGLIHLLAQRWHFPDWLTAELIHHLQRFWDEPGLLAAHRMGEDGSFWEYPSTYSYDQANGEKPFEVDAWRMAEAMICYEQERMDRRRIWGSNKRDTDAMAGFRAYSDILLRRFLLGMRLGPYVGISPRLNANSIRYHFAHPKYIPERYKLSEMKNWVTGGKNEMSEILREARVISPITAPLLERATGFYYDEAFFKVPFNVESLRGLSTLGQFLLKRRSTLTPLQLVEFMLVTGEYNLEWAIAAM